MIYLLKEAHIKIYYLQNVPLRFLIKLLAPA